LLNKLIYLLTAEVSEAKEGFMVVMNKYGDAYKTKYHGNL
jgi:hypothetical protein